MTAHSDKKDAIKDAKDVKREGWVEESKGQAEKWAGKLTGDKEKEAEGAEHQLAGNAEKHIGKMAEEAAKV